MSNSSAKQSSSQFDPTGKIVDQGAALRQSLIWLVGILIFVALVAWRGFVTVDHRDFDYKTLKTNEVVFRPRMPGNRTLRARIRDVTNSPPPDILFLGNHVMRGMTFGPQENGLDFRNFVIGNPSLHELSMLLKRFEGTGKLPKKAIIIGLLAHSHNHLLNDSGLKIFLTDWSKEKSINDLYKRALIYLGWKIRPLWDFRTFLNGFIGDEAASVRIDYKNCLAANAKGLPSDNSERLRLKIS